ncbi:glutamate racemase [Candidatus Gottesmanbacteria bacterium RBG_16_52_11]|uniref:Glutamate racemase n=1 Tax=Candidatus Gottesmanbacteria bacterium RBG_16_52_11 TaxID=1798374 RepID=A0A1F5YU94_9BACT|nr:MAG: glutamate racemase [Candidatus Gottesmanbacteria bacterium RBG_16_52_11]
MKRPIGVIDSGSGGLTVRMSIVRELPGESTIYVGDHKYLPYGEKPAGFIRQRISRLIRYLLTRRIKLVVIACNTATVAGIDDYRKEFPGLPVVGVVPVVKKAAEVTRTGHIAVLSTSFTAGSAYQKELIRNFTRGKQVINLAAPDLVTKIEEGQTDTPEITRILTASLIKLRGKPVDTLALGCTHYPFIRDTISRIVGDRITILDSGDAVARHVRRILTSNNALQRSNGQTHRFVTTGDPVRVNRSVSRLLREKVKFIGVDLD